MTEPQKPIGLMTDEEFAAWYHAEQRGEDPSEPVSRPGTVSRVMRVVKGMLIVAVVSWLLWAVVWPAVDSPGASCEVQNGSGLCVYP